jgi:hypothetical protein
MALMMEAVKTFETLVNLHQSTQHYSTEYSYLHAHRHENLKAYLINHAIYSVFTKQNRQNDLRNYEKQQ